MVVKTAAAASSSWAIRRSPRAWRRRGCATVLADLVVLAELADLVVLAARTFPATSVVLALPTVPAVAVFLALPTVLAVAVFLALWAVLLPVGGHAYPQLSERD